MTNLKKIGRFWKLFYINRLKVQRRCQRKKYLRLFNLKNSLIKWTPCLPKSWGIMQRPSIRSSSNGRTKTKKTLIKVSQIAKMKKRKRMIFMLTKIELELHTIGKKLIDGWHLIPTKTGLILVMKKLWRLRLESIYLK